MRKRLLWLALSTLVLSPRFARSEVRQQPAERPLRTFDVVSIRPSQGPDAPNTKFTKDGFVAKSATSKSRLLIYEPLETVDDGAAEAGSMGFYDVHDAPPWDTWFLYADHAVFCCVPEFAISRAQNGIDANPVDCIHWAEWSRLARLEN